MPFRAGEILNYRVAWAIFPNAAALQMNVVERRNLLGWQTWHFRASAHSQNPARTLFEVDDQFDSYTDTTTLESHQYELYLNEMGSQQNEVLHLIPVGQSARGAVAPVLVQPGTRDPLGAFYALRAVDWQRTPEFRVPVYDGSDLYEVRARQEAASEAVTLDAGNFQATQNLTALVRVRQRSSAHRFPACGSRTIRAHTLADARGDARGKRSCGIVGRTALANSGRAGTIQKRGLIFGNDPIIRREINLPECARRLHELDPHLRFSSLRRAHIHDAAFLCMLRGFVRQRNFLRGGYARGQRYQRAMRVYHQRARFFLEILIGRYFCPSP